MSDTALPSPAPIRHRPLHRARLVHPLPGPGLVTRERLLARLDHADGAFIAITAPAGFGKTTLVVDWLRQRGIEAAWLTLDDDDNDPLLLVTHLVAALQSLEPAFGARTLAHLESVDPTAGDALATAFANEALDLPRPLTLVLDDAHVLAHPLAIAFLDAVVLHPAPTLRLVFSSRHELPLALPAARGRGLVTDIRASDLRFREEEVASFLERSVGEPFAAEFVAGVTQRTDGWAACLRLLTTAIHQHADRQRFADDLLRDGDREIMDFLYTEVVANIRPETLTFLMLTAVCDRICSDLADALLAGEPALPDSRFILEEMLRQDIYVSRMSGDGVWYRFHPLFRSLLLETLAERHGADVVARQHARAGDWCASHGLDAEAIRHALLAGDPARAADLAAAIGFDAIDHERWNELPGLLALLPPDLVASRADLVLVRCWQAWNNGATDRLGADLARATALLASDSALPAAMRTRIEGHIAALTPVARYPHLAVDDSVASGRAALELLAGGSGVARGFALQTIASALTLDRRPTDAAAIVGPSCDTTITTSAGHGLVARAFIARASIHYIAAADLDRAAADNATALDLADAGRLHATANTARSNLAAIALGRLDCATARGHCQAILQASPIPTRIVWRDAMGALALIHGLHRERERAIELADEMVAFLESAGCVTALPSARSLRARIHLLAGDPDAAIAWATGIGLSVDTELPMYLDAQAITRARALLAVGDAAHRHAALAQTDRALANASRHGHLPLAARASAVRAIALVALDRNDEAVAALDLPLDLAARHDWILPLVELGRPLADLLAQAPADPVRSPTIDRVIAAIDAWCVGPSPTPPSASAPDEDALLTTREREIATLLAARLSNKEIATALTISPLTVKRHVSQIIAKLGAHDRRDAIDRARARGLV